MVGKTKAQVLTESGQPNSEVRRDPTILDPSKHTQAAIDEWIANTPSYGLEYDFGTVWFNSKDVVVKVEISP